MSDFTINFSDLKFNLYEILNVSPESNDQKIKKAFRNLIINFHPDKNSDAEEDIYQHIISANQILLNKELRKKYDEFLTDKVNDHFDLKKNFNKIMTTNEEPKISKDDAQKLFLNKMDELNKKHKTDGFENIQPKTYEQLLKERETIIEIPKENIDDTEDFNKKFESRLFNGNFNDQIISNNDFKLTTYNLNDNYSALDVAFDNLYINDNGVSTSKFTSLDSAFKIQSLPTFNEVVDIKDAITRYKQETSKFADPDFKFSKDQYSEW